MLNSTDKIIKHKTGLLNLAEELGNVSSKLYRMRFAHDHYPCLFANKESRVSQIGNSESVQPQNALKRGKALLTRPRVRTLYATNVPPAPIASLVVRISRSRMHSIEHNML